MIVVGDARSIPLQSASVDVAVTSVPYWYKVDYGIEGQIGLEDDPRCYVDRIASVFRELGRVLRPEGVAWLNISDSYFGDSHARRRMAETSSRLWRREWTRSRGGKRRSAARIADFHARCLVGVPWLIAAALMGSGWTIRAEVIWYKVGIRGEPVKDRPSRSHEVLFLLTRSRRYYYDDSRVEPWARGSVWTIRVEDDTNGHPAPFPIEIPLTCLRLTAKPGAVVIDPFCGRGTTGQAAGQLGLSFVGVDLSPEHAKTAGRLLAGVQPELF